MKITLLALLSTFLITACDNPQRTRATTALSGTSSDGVTAPTGEQNFNSGNTGGTTTGSTTGTTTGGTTTDVNFPACDLSYKYTASEIGQVAICQSTVDVSMFKFKTSQGSDSRVCLIPTYKDSTGASTWLGQPQCTTTTAGTVYSGKLYKTRTNYTNYPINGVLVMKEALLTEYFQCIDAYINFITQYCPLNPTNAQCVYEANRARNTLCTSFKSKYSNSYLDLPPSGSGSI